MLVRDEAPEVDRVPPGSTTVTMHQVVQRYSTAYDSREIEEGGCNGLPVGWISVFSWYQRPGSPQCGMAPSGCGFLDKFSELRRNGSGKSMRHLAKGGVRKEDWYLARLTGGIQHLPSLLQVAKRRCLVVGVVEDHELGCLSFERIGELVFEEDQRANDQLSASARHPWTPNQAMHSPLTDAAGAQAGADGSPTSPEREGHQGYERLLLEEEGPDKEGEGRGGKAEREGESSKAPEDESREEEPELSPDGGLIFERRVDLSELEGYNTLFDESELKLTSTNEDDRSDEFNDNQHEEAGSWPAVSEKVVEVLGAPALRHRLRLVQVLTAGVCNNGYPPATSPLGYNGTNRVTKVGVMHHRGPPSSSRVHTGERASIRVVEPRGELTRPHPTAYHAIFLSFDQGKAARLDPVMDLFDKNGSILGSTWAEAYPRRSKILRITPECSTTHLPGSKCVPDVDAERMIPQSLAFTILSAKSEWRFGFVTLLSMNGTDSNTR
ncbi:hypothetical protein BKA70DRAFT_1408690 [Coprinopsis sp. MPI-PUGE-AT-0042]|nr:hypothetical protein BKA70DRAFT_1408690 [Coprinopsis sp. MPI-PUGE-AT-0042]